MSTPPPAEYGTKICTGLDGNDDCADATLHAIDIAIAEAAIPNHPFKVSLPIVSLLLFIGRLIAHLDTKNIAASRRSQVRSEHVDNPADRVKFRRLNRTFAITLRAKILAKRKIFAKFKGEFDGGCRGTNIVPDLA
jgi:hypothetical protein